jgi:hypothetical protein
MNPLKAFDWEQFSWRQTCQPVEPCPNISWFWLTAAVLGAILLLKRKQA